MQTQICLRSQWNLAATRSCPWMPHGDRDLFQVAGCDLLGWEELAVSFLRLVYYYKGSSSSEFILVQIDRLLSWGDSWHMRMWGYNLTN